MVGVLKTVSFSLPVHFRDPRTALPLPEVPPTELPKSVHLHVPFRDVLLPYHSRCRPSIRLHLPSGPNLTIQSLPSTLDTLPVPPVLVRAQDVDKTGRGRSASG